ncbi:DUF4402 domain-containing protein [Rhodoferax sp. PAMC 29310]|uniref:DUF4402 domain-containing protein n=1 Tax=Rhodoferax sp. PAMC 29310 TaxID=2822760 RepID=UPI001B32B4FE|nr:DUF4402 domain-containing protein [Rhodoferax sp. PAMC 29310]
MFHKFHPAKIVVVLASVWTALALPALAAVTVTKTADLSFGKLVPGATSGTVTISPIGVRTASSSVTLFNQASTQQAAVFAVSGGPLNTTCELTVPTSFTSLTASSAPMELSSFSASNVSNTAISLTNSVGSITLDGLGAYTVKVGATLTVGASEPAGAYTGNISVTVTCP